MDQKDIEHLENLLRSDFNKYIKNRMAGYCQRDYRIAKASGLNPVLIKSMGQMYFDKFKLNINNYE